MLDSYRNYRLHMHDLAFQKQERYWFGTHADNPIGTHYADYRRKFQGHRSYTAMLFEGMVMKYKTIDHNGKLIVRVESTEVLISDVPSALDLMASLRYETGANCLILDKSALAEQFFDLKTCVAGDILQKFVTYRMKLAIIGDFRTVSSNSLRNFIYESNKGNDIFFVQDEQLAIEYLSRN